MNPLARNLLGLCLVIAFAAFTFYAFDLPLDWVRPQFHVLRNEFIASPLRALVGFCILHLICSLIGIPGGCTVLNISAGAVFGFWYGCAVVYFITIVSAVLMYLFGEFIRDRKWMRRFDKHTERMRANIKNFDYFVLISLRISPLLPFGPLNLALSLMGVPFMLYLLTTTVGVFFDVTVLNALGATAGAHGDAPTQTALLIVFAGLLTLFLFFRTRLASAYDLGTEPSQ